MEAKHWFGARPKALKERGVIAYHYIDAGECFERADTIQLDAKESNLLKQTRLGNYFFAHPADPDGVLLVLGLASLCNQSDDPNAQTVARKDGGAGWVVEMYAVRAIKPGDEITRRDACDLWFDLSE